MILLADAGSTKTDWALVEGCNMLVRCITQGINPFQQMPEDIDRVLRGELLPELEKSGTGTGQINEIHFFGAGCNALKAPVVARCLKLVFAEADMVEVDSDMLGAAYAVCGREAGIACILGTGANSCYFDGQKMAEHVPPLGYLLGDEGSGAYLGRELLRFVLRGMVAAETLRDFEEQYHLTEADVIERVYRKPLANRFLAGFVPFVTAHLSDSVIKAMVDEAFTRFIERQVGLYAASKSVPIHFIGGVAWTYQQQLTALLEAHGMSAGRFLKTPMDGLIAFYMS